MATLAESFLADLDELSDEELPQQDEGGDAAMPAADGGGAGGGAGPPPFSNRLASSARYASVMAAVRAALAEDDAAAASGQQQQQQQQQQQPGAGDAGYQLVADAVALAADADAEIVSAYHAARDLYRPAFPELESLVAAPLDYCRVAAALGPAPCDGDGGGAALEALLPPAAVMAVAVTATTTAGRPLPRAAADAVAAACAAAASLDADRAALLALVQRRMAAVAPALSAVVGPGVAARLVGAAGGLAQLAAMPACNVLVLGAKRRALAGFSSRAAPGGGAPHQGLVYEADLVAGAPPALRARAARAVAAKCALLARVDAHGGGGGRDAGARLRAELEAKIEKWQEPPPARQALVLPVPDAEVKKRRGGRRHRRHKELYGETDLRKAANRLMFDQPEEEVMDGEDTIGLGALGKDGSGRLRALAAAQRQKLSAKAAKKYKGGFGGGAAAGGATGAPVSGLSSSLAFTPVQGIELVDPARRQEAVDAANAALAAGRAGAAGPGGTESYFGGSYAGFRAVQRAAQAQQAQQAQQRQG